MTCVVGHKAGWMVADRRMIWNSLGLAPFLATKIWKMSNGSALVGFSGAFDQIWARLPPDVFYKDALSELPSIIRDAPGERYSAMVVRKDSLGVITEHGVYHQCQADWWAIGSGTEAALGWLGALGRVRELKPQDAIDAINFAATLDAGVGDGTQVELL